MESASLSHQSRAFNGLRAGDLRNAAVVAGDHEPKAVQFDDRRDEAKAKALGTPAFVGSVEALGHGLAFDFSDAGTSVLHADCSLSVPVKQSKFHASALWRELHRIVDQIGDGLEQEIAVAVHESPNRSTDL